MTQEDETRKEFLRDLDDADHIDLTDWETKFVGQLAYYKFDSYSDKQREHIDRLKQKYQRKL
jgi:hypothetical protein